MAVARAQISVDETATRAKIVNGETRIYLALNSGFPNPVAVQVLLKWRDLSGAMVNHVEAPFTAPPGKSFVEAALGLYEEDALFMRLHYSVTASYPKVGAFSPLEGMLSFPHIADHAFVLTGAAIGFEPRPGTPYEFRVFASHPLTGRPVRGVVVKAERVSAITDANGAAVLRYKPDPEDWDEEDLVKVEGRLGDVTRTVEIWRPAVKRGTVRIYSDKPLYQPGQAAHIRILATGPDSRVRAEATYCIRILDKKSTAVQVDRAVLADLVANRYLGIDSVETASDHVTFYFWRHSDPMMFDFTFRPRYAMHARMAPSVLYDYYNPDERVVAPPVSLVVEDK